jgi:hypothetical protein
VNLDISALGYRWRGIYSPYLSYRDGDVVFKDGGAWVIRHGQPQPFALGQQDAILKGHLLTGGVSVGGIASMVLEDRILLPQRKWLRLTMANDPGAAIFEDHVPVAIAEIG